MREKLQTANDVLGLILLVAFLAGLFIGLPELREQHGDTLTTSGGRTIAMDDYTIGIIAVIGALIVGFLRGRLWSFLALCVLAGAFYWLISQSGGL